MAGKMQGLGRHDGAGESQHPDSDAFAPALPEIDHRRAQAEAASLREGPEGDADAKPPSAASAGSPSRSSIRSIQPSIAASRPIARG